MARYMETAAKANKVAKQLLALIPEDKHPSASAYIAQLVNLGVRVSPRPCQSTVRYNAVREAVKGLPVKVSMQQVTDPVSHKTYNALSVTAIGQELTVNEDGNGDEE